MMLESNAASDEVQPARSGARLPVHAPLLLGRALMLLADGWASSGAVRWLDPELVLAEAWAPRRLQRCREQLAAGQQASTIHVVGLRLPRRRVFYSVSDGTHRAVAHREAGKKVKARISGYYLIEPARHVLRQDRIWRHAESELRWIGSASDELRPWRRARHAC